MKPASLAKLRLAIHQLVIKHQAEELRVQPPQASEPNLLHLADLAQANAIEQCAVEAGERSPEGVSSHTMLGDMWDRRIRNLRDAKPGNVAPTATPAPLCELCHHSLKDNLHGFDQNDADFDGDNLVHSGHCTYCKECNPALGRLLLKKRAAAGTSGGFKPRPKGEA